MGDALHQKERRLLVRLANPIFSRSDSSFRTDRHCQLHSAALWISNKLVLVTINLFSQQCNGPLFVKIKHNPAIGA